MIHVRFADKQVRPDRSMLREFAFDPPRLLWW
jgi:hypothetical protein